MIAELGLYKKTKRKSASTILSDLRIDTDGYGVGHYPLRWAYNTLSTGLI